MTRRFIQDEVNGNTCIPLQYDGEGWLECNEEGKEVE